MNAVSPEAELMGGIGIAALAVNVTAALVLARFREGGDAQARAIWLFSRNDAINNVAVIIAAGLVYWLHSAWPALVVAAVIAAIFLHSAWELLRHARAERTEDRKRGVSGKRGAGRVDVGGCSGSKNIKQKQY